MRARQATDADDGPLLVLPDELEFRVHLRNEFNVAGLHNLLPGLRTYRHTA